MPYISVTTSKTLTPETIEEIKTDLGKAITLIPGKNEGGLMIGFSNADMYMSGKKSDSAFLCVKIFGTSTKEAFKNLSEEISKIMSDRAGITNVYVNFEEHKIWGAGGSLIG